MLTDSLDILNWRLKDDCETAGVPKHNIRLIEMSSHGLNFSAHEELPSKCWRVVNRNVEFNRQLPFPPNITNARLLHVIRNPLEMIVSSYGYDMEELETQWQHAPFRGIPACESHFNNFLQSVDPHSKAQLDSCNGGTAAALHCSAVHAVRSAAHPVKGELAGILPKVHPSAYPNGTWLTYLESLDEDEALLAEAIMMSSLALKNMAIIGPSVRSLVGPWVTGTTHQAVCENEFEEATMPGCTRMWLQVVKGLGFSGNLTRLASKAAEASCPGSKTAQASLSAHNSATGNLTEASDRVKRLIRLDRDYLGGRLARMTLAQPCGLSDRYTSAFAERLTAERAATERAKLGQVLSHRSETPPSRRATLGDQHMLMP